MKKIVLLRHGESIWNQENRFTGWIDVGLSERGLQEAVQAGRTLAQEGYTFEVAFTSMLKRAIKTLWLTLEEMDLMWIPVEHSWRLNERHYGALARLEQGRNRGQVREEQVKIWRRSYDVPPPPLSLDDPHYPGRDPRYAGLRPEEIPLTECLKDAVARFLPYWQETVAPAVAAGRQVLIAAHGNSLRALVKYLDGVPEAEIVGLNIPTGIPLVYELNDDLTPIRHYYLGDPEAVARAIQSVADQLKKKP